MHVNVSNLLGRAFCDLNVIPNVLPLKLFELINQNPPKMFLFFKTVISLTGQRLGATDYY